MPPLNGREGGAHSRHRTAQEVLIRTQVGPPATGSFATTVLTASRATGVIYSPLSLFKLSNTPACVKPRRQSAAASPEGPAGLAVVAPYEPHQEQRVDLPGPRHAPTHGISPGCLPTKPPLS